jgi:hypothetical protein
MERIWNNDKNRKATPNEMAKHLIIDLLESQCALGERYGMGDVSDEVMEEVCRHYEKHLSAIVKRFNLDYTSVRRD